MKSGDAVLPDVLPKHVDGLRSKVRLSCTLRFCLCIVLCVLH